MSIASSPKKSSSFQLYLFCLIGLFFAFYAGFYWGNTYFSQQQEQLSVQQESIQNLKAENEKLVKNLNILGVELEVAVLTQNKHFEEQVQSIEREKALRTQVAFYQKVMAPELNEDGFLIDGFNIERALSDDSYRFELVMIQQTKTKNTLKGTLDITLMGSENGVSKQYALASLLTSAEQKELTFGFKYFQVIEGELRLPAGFQPEQVSVHAEIFQFKRKKGELTTLFDWEITEFE